MSSFNDLPNEIIVNILKNLKSTNLLSARLVCLRWARLISDNSVLRRRYGLRLTKAEWTNQHPFVVTFSKSIYRIPAIVRIYDVVFALEVLSFFDKIGRDIEYLSIELTSSRRCNKRHNYWYWLIHKTPNLKIFKFQIDPEIIVAKHITSTVIGAYALDKLQEVHLECFKGVEEITNILKINAPNIKALHINDNSTERLAPEVVKSLIELVQCLKLEILKVDDDHSEFPNTEELKNILKHQPNLRELNCHLDDVENFPELDNLMTKMEKLSLVSFSEKRNVLVHIPSNLSNLVSLTINLQCSDDPIVDITNVTRNTKLEVFNFDCSSDGDLEYGFLSDDTLKCLAYNYPNLKKLDLHDYKSLSCGVTVIVDKLRELEELNISFIFPQSDSDKEALSKIANLTKLRVLTLSSYFCDDSFLIDHLQIPSLRSVHLDYEVIPNDEITNAGVHAMIKNLPLLENIRFIGINNITDECVANLPDQLPKLETAYMRCKNVSNKLVQEISNTLNEKSLKKFYDKHGCTPWKNMIGEKNRFDYFD